MHIDRPHVTEYASFYAGYIAKVGDDVMQQLTNQLDWMLSYLEENKGRLDYRYGPDKWTIREAFVHIADTEQIFACRSLRVSRGDTTALPGFEQNAYIAENDFSHLSLDDLVSRIKNVRNQSMSFIKSLTQDDLLKLGYASGKPVSTRALIYQIAGHTQHHIDIFEERYG